MTAQLHNPPAYPCAYNEVSDGKLETVTFLGMSLRDYFAGQALACFSATQIASEDTARVAYAIADALLKERQK